MTDEPHDHGDDFSMVTPFWIDTDGYSDRDRLMFVCGVEFEMVRRQLETGGNFERTIHTENESRLRLLCSRHGCEVGIEPAGKGWSFLAVKARA